VKGYAGRLGLQDESEHLDERPKKLCQAMPKRLRDLKKKKTRPEPEWDDDPTPIALFVACFDRTATENSCQ